MSRVVLLGGALTALLPVSAAMADEAPQVEEIVVTGEKTQRSLQDTIASVAVVTARRIEEENLQNLSDIVNRTANVAETYGAAGFTIRGISNANVSGGGSGSLVTVFVDGAPLPDHALSSGPLDMWDVQQVEILRGPQSTLQGRNALAGAVVIRTKDPTWTWSGDGRIIYSDENSRSVALAGGGPIVADQLAFRLSFEDLDSDGFVYNTTRKTNENPTRATTVRGKLLFTPSTLPDLTVRAGVTHDERKGGYIFSYARTDVPDAAGNRISTGDYPNDNDTTTDIINVTGDYKISDRLALTSVTTWSKVDSFSRFDADDTAASIAYGTEAELDRTFTQELRLQYQGERLSGLVGAYYANRDSDDVLKTLNTTPTPKATLVGVLMSPMFGLNAATANAAANAYVAALPNVAVDFHGDAPEQVETFAVFADGRFQLTPQLSLLAGLRYDREKNTQSVTQTARFAGTYPNPAAFGSLAPVVAGLNQVVGLYVAQASAVQPDSSRTFEAFLPKLGLKYDITDDASLSFVVQRGYRSGGSTINVARSTVVPYDPEYTWNYELALRTAWLDDTLTLNANAYYVDWSDQQVSINLGSSIYDTQTQNAASSHLYGAELEATYRPSTAWDVYGSLGYSHTEFDDFKLVNGSMITDLSGTEFAFAPNWTWAVGGNYRWDNGFLLNLNASYRSDAYGSRTGPDQIAGKIDARTLVNGKLGYQAQHWALSVFANNIFDEQYVQFAQPTLHRAMFGAPRVVGAVLETRW